MIGLPFVYALAGLTFLAFAVLSLRDPSNPKRWGNGAFWGLLALSMLAGDRLGDFGNGLLVLALVAIAGMGQLGRDWRHGGRGSGRVRCSLWQQAVPAGAGDPRYGSGWDVRV